jgi:alkanesulfonate monooxygenase SsuD/methylene tetrahydromethanopterin reductase-like flavin-dependent oxidoreductase (luciferase family)
MAQLQLGFFDSFAEYEMSGVAADVYDEHIADVQLAEQLGYQYYFFIEHQNAAFTCITSPDVYLAALARETSRIRIGPMVYQLPMYHPVRLAQDSAMVDQLSRGRLEFGVGYGTRVDEFRRWKVNFAERREMGVEALEIILKAWTQDQVTYEGEYWQLDEAMPKPKPYQQPHPPIWVGAHSPTSFDYAAKYNYHVAQNIDVDAVAAEKFAYFKQAWEKQGHGREMPHRMLVRHVHVAETDDQARAEAEPYLKQGMRATSYAAPTDIAARPAEERTPERAEFARVYAGTAGSAEFWIENESVVKQLRDQQARVGHDVFAAQHQISSMPRDLARKSLRLFGEQVVPAFATSAKGG